MLLIPAVAFAAGGNDYIISQGTGMGTIFDTKLIEISRGLLEGCQKILLILTAVAGMMIAWGMEDGKKMVWQLIFGFGVAANFGSLLMDVGIWDFVSQADLAKQNFIPFQFEYKADSKDFDFLGKFLANYQNNIIIPGAIAILPYCLKLLVIICIIDATYEYAAKSLSGDKIQYTISVLFKLGLYIYFMSNWIELMNALETGFEFLGFKAGGADYVNLNAQPNAIVDNALKICATQLSDIFKSFKETWYMMIIFGIVIFAIFVCLIITACELFMAKIEFLTMSLLTLPLLAFGTSEKFSFLTNKAIGAMFNLALKVCCVCFITTFSVPFIQSFYKQAETTPGFWSSLGILLQTLLGCLILVLMTTKIPSLVQGLLSGSPSLSGGSMKSLVVPATRAAHAGYAGYLGAKAGVASATAKATAAGATAGTGALAMSAVTGGVTGTLMDLAKQAAFGSTPYQTFRGIEREQQEFSKLMNGEEGKKKESTKDTENKGESGTGETKKTNETPKNQN